MLELFLHVVQNIQPVVYARESDVQVLEEIDTTLQERARLIAREYKIPEEKFINLFEGESHFNPDAIGALGELGIAQILPSAHPKLTVEQMKDPIWSMEWTAKELQAGREYQWTNCSCISLARALGVKIPKGTDASELLPNSYPVIGGLVLLKYAKISHVAVIRGFDKEGNLIVSEGNFKPCARTTRIISLVDKAIVGFYKIL